MSIRSDVALALKHHVYTGLSKESKDFLSNDFEKCETTAEGVLFHVTNIKWYYDEDEDIRRLYFELRRGLAEDYLILVACHDYPDAEDGNIGEWQDNPWGIYKDVTVSIKFG